MKLMYLFCIFLRLFFHFALNNLFDTTFCFEKKIVMGKILLYNRSLVIDLMC